MKLTYIATAGLIVLVSAGVYLVVQNDSEGRMQEMQANMDRKLLQQEKLFKDQVQKTEAEAQRKLKEAADIAKASQAKPGDLASNDAASVKKGLDNVKKNVLKAGGPADTAPAPGAVASEPPDLGPMDPEARAKLEEEKIINAAGVGTERIVRETGKVKGVLPDDDNGEKLNDIQSLIVAQPRIARVGDARPAEKGDFVVLDEGLNKGLAKGDRFSVRRGTVIVARIVIGDNIQATQCVADIVPKSIPDGLSIKDGDDVIKFDR